MNLENNDALYYIDLIYEVKRIAGCEQKENEEIETRIRMRYFNEPSVFKKEISNITADIIVKTNANLTDLSELSKFPELLTELLDDLEEKKNQADNGNCLYVNGPVLTRKIK